MFDWVSVGLSRDPDNAFAELSRPVDYKPLT